jgi:4-amino-4-deoxy-L-arabinose transferase-like glycosyltransferase
VPTKLPHYVLPLIPALCLLGGIGFIQASPTQGDSRLTSKWPEKIGFATWILAGTIIALGLPTLSILATGRISAATLLTCLACIAALALTLRLRIPRQRLAASAASAVVIFGLIFEFALPGLTPAWPAETMRKTIASRGLEGVPISISEFHEPSAVFNLGTQTKLTDLEGVIAHSSSLPEAIAIVPSSQASELKQKLPKIIKSRLLGHINGFNYSKGKSINLDIIYTNQAPGSQPQANK